MTRTYLGPWQWQADADAVGWVAPAGCIGAVDLRPVPLQGIAGGTPGMGLFVTESALPAEFTLLGTGEPDEVRSTARHRAAWKALAGYTPQGDTLAGLLWDHLTRGADPSGDAGPRPLMPGQTGQAHWHDLYLHRRVRSEPFAWGDDPEATGRVRVMLRREFRELFDLANGGRLRDRQQHRRVLDFWCERFGVDDWREFVPTDLRAEVPGRLRHETSITESFNKADSSTLGPDQTWTEYAGVSAGDKFTIVSNQVRSTSTGGDNPTARAESDLSSADHYAQVDVTNLGSGTENRQCGSATRFHPTANTCYVARAIRATVNALRILKMTAGVGTDLTSAGISMTVPFSVKCEANGSTLKGYRAGVEVVSTTDTSITGNLRCGIWAFSNALGTGFAELDNFSASDLAASGILYTQLERSVRGIQRGVYHRF